MNRSHLSPILRVVAFALVIHLLASVGTSGTVPARRRHRRSAAQKAVAPKAPTKPDRDGLAPLHYALRKGYTFLKSGQRLRLWIEKIGELHHGFE